MMLAARSSMDGVLGDLGAGLASLERLKAAAAAAVGVLLPLLAALLVASAWVLTSHGGRRGAAAWKGVFGRGGGLRGGQGRAQPRSGRGLRFRRQVNVNAAHPAPSEPPRPPSKPALSPANGAQAPPPSAAPS